MDTVNAISSAPSGMQRAPAVWTWPRRSSPRSPSPLCPIRERCRRRGSASTDIAACPRRADARPHDVRANVSRRPHGRRADGRDARARRRDRRRVTGASVVRSLPRCRRPPLAFAPARHARAASGIAAIAAISAVGPVEAEPGRASATRKRADRRATTYAADARRSPPGSTRGASGRSRARAAGGGPGQPGRRRRPGVRRRDAAPRPATSRRAGSRRRGMPARAIAVAAAAHPAAAALLPRILAPALTRFTARGESTRQARAAPTRRFPIRARRHRRGSQPAEASRAILAAMQYAASILDLIGKTPARPDQPDHPRDRPARAPAARAREARDAEPRRERQGPDRAADDRGRRAGGPPPGRAARSSSRPAATPGTAWPSPPCSRAIAASSSWPTSSRRRSRRILRAYGAEVVLCPTNVAPESPESYYSVAARLARDIPGAFKPDQYWNTENPAAHEATTGPEIWQQTEGAITHLVASVGTGGTITRRRALPADAAGDPRSSAPTRRAASCRATPPARTSPRASARTSCPARSIRRSSTGGSGCRIATPSRWPAGSPARRASSPANLSGPPWSRPCRSTGADGRGPVASDVVVVILPDGGRNYLSKLYNDEWMRANGLLAIAGRGRPRRATSCEDRHHGEQIPDLVLARTTETVGIGDRPPRGLRRSARCRSASGRRPDGRSASLVGSISEKSLLERAYRDPDGRGADGRRSHGSRRCPSSGNRPSPRRGIRAARGVPAVLAVAADRPIAVGMKSPKLRTCSVARARLTMLTVRARARAPRHVPRRRVPARSPATARAVAGAMMPAARRRPPPLTLRHARASTLARSPTNDRGGLAADLPDRARTPRMASVGPAAATSTAAPRTPRAAPGTGGCGARRPRPRDRVRERARRPPRPFAQLATSGEEIVVGDDVYGGTYRYFERVHRPARSRCAATWISPRARIVLGERAQPDRTRLVWFETPTNPLLKLIDIAGDRKRGRARVAAQSRGRRPIIVVDNTFASPAIQQPLAMGADIVSTRRRSPRGTQRHGSRVAVTNDDAVAPAPPVPPERDGRRARARGLLPRAARHPDAGTCGCSGTPPTAWRSQPSLAEPEDVAEVRYPGLRRERRRAFPARRRSTQMAAGGGMVASCTAAGGPGTGAPAAAPGACRGHQRVHAPVDACRVARGCRVARRGARRDDPCSVAGFAASRCPRRSFACPSASRLPTTCSPTCCRRSTRHRGGQGRAFQRRRHGWRRRSANVTAGRVGRARAGLRIRTSSRPRHLYNRRTHAASGGGGRPISCPATRGAVMARVPRRKVTVIGAGNVGATTAQQIVETGLARRRPRRHRRGPAPGQGAST